LTLGTGQLKAHDSRARRLADPRASGKTGIRQQHVPTNKPDGRGATAWCSRNGLLGVRRELLFLPELGPWTSSGHIPVGQRKPAVGIAENCSAISTGDAHTRLWRSLPANVFREPRKLRTRKFFPFRKASFLQVPFGRDWPVKAKDRERAKQKRARFGNQGKALVGEGVLDRCAWLHWVGRVGRQPAAETDRRQSGRMPRFWRFAIQARTILPPDGAQTPGRHARFHRRTPPYTAKL
jgi:hypothetical protein